MDAYIQENACDINLLYMEFHSSGDITSTITNQLKAQNADLRHRYRAEQKVARRCTCVNLRIRLNEKYRTRSFSSSDLAELDCLCVIEEL